jgi:hypothetical protein
MVQPVELYQWHIEPATLKIVAQHLKGKAIPVKTRTSLEHPRNFMIDVM